MLHEAQHGNSASGQVAYPGFNWIYDDNYRDRVSFIHRRNGIWEGQNVCYFDGHSSWRNANEMLDTSQPNQGAKWLMWDNRGIYESPNWW